MKVWIEVANLSREMKIVSNVRRTTESKENFEKINSKLKSSILKNQKRMKREISLCLVNKFPGEYLNDERERERGTW